MYQLCICTCIPTFRRLGTQNMNPAPIKIVNDKVEDIKGI